ncbi:hypothetical protein RRG08_005027 [Elysia crispata]|uniref:Uncharacterized protein n=1 Tax=Elysia crispata TaxID=231223 RepID=A0AAE1E8W6_9GAST|nr:hypothetical protein RRG08_005027 [Elysia crispata]
MTGQVGADTTAHSGPTGSCKSWTIRTELEWAMFMMLAGLGGPVDTTLVELSSCEEQCRNSIDALFAPSLVN